MNFSSFHQPYAHKTRFKVVHSTTTLVKIQTSSPNTSRFKLVRDTPKSVSPIVAVAKTVIVPKVSKSLERSSTTVLAKSIGNKYKWIRTNSKRTENNAFKLDRRTVSLSTTATGRIVKRKPHGSLSKRLVRIRGIGFHTNHNGKCLQRLASDSDNSRLLSSPTSFVKKIETPLVTRASILLQRSIQISNGRYRLRNTKKKTTTTRKNCIYFNRFGKCHRGDKCPFVHDRTRIAVCTQFLNGRCKNASCPYSHELTPGKVPTCSYFIKGACGQDNCPYAHSYVGHDAQICDDFVQGFCAKGAECSKQHVLLCPQFEATGQCPRDKQCHLTHRRKRKRRVSTKIIEQSTSISLPSIMPAYIPLNQESETQADPVMSHIGLKLKPSFLS